MKCPKCNNLETKVIDSRVIEEGKAIRRRRECEYCNHRFTTFEKIGITDLVVLKRSGGKEMYDRAKIKRALLLAFANRDINTERIEEIISDLEGKFQVKGKEITSKEIGNSILDILKKIDIVAYIRFASVYKNFESIDDFEQIISDAK